MSKRLEKTISIVMAVLLMLSVLPLSSFAEEKHCDCDHVPIIYAYGRQTTYDDPTSENRRDLQNIPDSAFTEIAEGAAPYLLKAVPTNNYDDFCDYLVKSIVGLLGEFSCDKEGNVKDKSGIEYNWSPENPDTLGDYHKDDNVYSYVFLYDARLDPLEVADDLKVYIDAVKRVTGHDTVNIVSRCMGSQYAMAYFVKYGWSDIETFVQNCTSVNGTTIMSSIFAGKVKFDADAIERFVMEDSVKYDEFTRIFISLFNKMKALGLATTVINLVFDRIKTDVVPEALIKTYGTCPGYWSMVSSEDYDDAMKNIFGGGTMTIKNIAYS